MLSFHEFADYVAVELGLDADRALDKSVRLFIDLEFDSIRMLELLVAVEDLGVELAEDVFVTVQTLGDIYDRYAEKVVTENDQAAVIRT